ncbi:MAG: site-specific integrase [Verrucomicrobia bacterium]|nr:site-specific integrase [Verrucomicrobiota bacterium]
MRIPVWSSPSVRRGKTYERWEFKFHDPQLGRLRIRRATRRAAADEARKIALRIARAEFTVKGRQAADYAEADLIAARWGVSVAEAMREFDAARRARAVSPIVTKSTADIIAELLKELETDCGALYRRDLRLRLGRFEKEVRVPLAQLTGPALNDWLGALPVGARTRKNYRAAVGALVAFAKFRDYLPAKFAAFDDAARRRKKSKVKAGPASIEGKIISPEHLRILIRFMPRAALPGLLMGAFAGLRTSECLKVQWSDVDWEENLIRVPADTKTGERFVPVPANLRAWLEPLRGAGRMVKMGFSGWSQATARGVRKANEFLAREHSGERMRWKRNGLRHTAASCHALMNPNLAEVADQFGHSVKMLREVYRKAMKPSQAKAWFAIVPDAADKVIQLSIFEQSPGPRVVPAPAKAAGLG